MLGAGERRQERPARAGVRARVSVRVRVCVRALATQPGPSDSPSGNDSRAVRIQGAWRQCLGRVASAAPRGPCPRRPPTFSHVCCRPRNPRALPKTFDVCESPSGFLVAHLLRSPTEAAKDIKCPSRPGFTAWIRVPTVHAEAMRSTSVGRRWKALEPRQRQPGRTSTRPAFGRQKALIMSQFCVTLDKPPSPWASLP